MITIALADPPELPAGSRDVYLPIIGGPPPPPEPKPETSATAFVALLTSDKRQQRRSLEVCACLEQAATWKAQDIAEHGYWSHRASTGEFPNFTARRFGCNLPTEYGDGNQIESLVAGSGDATTMFAALAESPSHRTHLFGENSFFRAQSKMGIAVFEKLNTEYQWYWVILIAVCE